MENNIRKIREILGIKQSELAEKTGLSDSYISLLENNTRQNPTLNVMMNIANALGKDIKDVFRI